MGTSAAATIRDYYGALRAGEPLEPYFHDAGSPVKFGISETLAGYDAIVEGLRAQTRRTADWTVESHALRVTERECHAWFTDDVRLAWTEIDTGDRHGFDSRWSGTLEHDGGWGFVGMHVSTSHEI